MKSSFFKVLPLTALILLGGCNGVEPDTVCREILPRTRANIRAAFASLEPWRSGDGREPASGAAARFDELAQRDRDSWMSWSVERLDELQEQLDALETEPRYRRLRARVAGSANDVVVFYGAASRGDVKQMSGILERLDAGLSEVERELCLNPPGEATQARPDMLEDA